MKTIRDVPRAVGLLVIGLASGGAAAGILLDQPYRQGQLPLGVGLAAAAIAACLAARQGVGLSDDGVYLRYPLRTKFVPWRELVCFKVAPAKNLFGEKLAKPAALLRSGVTLPIPGANRFAFFQRDAYATRFPVVDHLEQVRRQKQFF